MALSTVSITVDAMEVCMSHALTTETEEIIGLLLGDVVDVGGQGKGEERLKARVWSVSLHRREQAVRSDDRVEISPEQLAAAAGEAERMSIELGIHTRVVGWYHSHPHLAVVPSHVDVRTQAQYQQLDSAFVGLIFSVFNSGRVVPGVPTGTQELGTGEAATTVSMNAYGSGRVQMTAFQSRAVNAEGQALPPLPPHSVSNWTQGAPADWPWNAQAGSPSSYTHKEIGIEVVPEGQLLPDRRCLPCLTKLALLQNILREEERQAFLKSVGAHAHSNATGSSRSPADIVGGEGSAGHEGAGGAGVGRCTQEERQRACHPFTDACHPLVAVHNQAVYQKSLSRLLESCQVPLISVLEGQLVARRSRIEAIRAEKRELLHAMRDRESSSMSHVSPH